MDNEQDGNSFGWSAEGLSHAHTWVHSPPGSPHPGGHATLFCLRLLTRARGLPEFFWFLRFPFSQPLRSLEMSGDRGWVKQTRVTLDFWHQGKQRGSVSRFWNHASSMQEGEPQVCSGESWCSRRSRGPVCSQRLCYGLRILILTFFNLLNILLSLWHWVNPRWKQEYSRLFREGETSCDIPYTSNLRNDTDELTSRKGLTDWGNELTVSSGEGCGGRTAREPGMVMYSVSKMDHQRGPTVWHRELCWRPCGSLDGRGVWGRRDACVRVAESLCRPPETITTLLTDSAPIQNTKLKKKKRIRHLLIHIYWFGRSH